MRILQQVNTELRHAVMAKPGFRSFRGTMAGAILSIGLAWPSGADGALITQIGTSVGDPGGQPVYEVSGLVQGDWFFLTWGGVDGLSADGTVHIDSLTSTDADINITINNTSTPTSSGNPKLVSFGLSIDNIDTGSPLNTTTTGGTYLTFADASNFPGFAMVDACGTSGSNCAGGAGGGIPAGSTDAFVLSVNGVFGATPLLTLDSFAIKIQGGPDGIVGDSYELAGVPSVPLPAALPLFLSALAGLGFMGWRRRQADA